MHLQDGRVVSNFIVQALKNEQITVYGAGEQTRSFCYVDDLIDGLIRMMASPDEVTGPINLGNPQECSILELAERIIDMTNSKSKIVHLPLPKDDPGRRCPDITRAMDTLKWKPKVALEDGLSKTIPYFEQQLSET
jgi:UDP-glucuronate decarboxylase